MSGAHTSGHAVWPLAVLRPHLEVMAENGCQFSYVPPTSSVVVLGPMAAIEGLIRLVGEPEYSLAVTLRRSKDHLAEVAPLKGEQ